MLVHCCGNPLVVKSVSCHGACIRHLLANLVTYVDGECVTCNTKKRSPRKRLYDLPVGLHVTLPPPDKLSLQLVTLIADKYLLTVMCI